MAGRTPQLRASRRQVRSLVVRPRTGQGAGHDGLGPDVDGHAAGGVGDGVHRVADAEILAVEPLGVADAALGGLGDLGHGGHRLHRVLAHGGLPGEHDGTGSVVDGVGHVGDLRPGGPGVLDHGLQHLRGGDDPLAQKTALGNQPLLDGGQLLKGHLHPQVTPADHDALAGLTDLLDVVDAGLIFDLGDEADVVRLVLAEEVVDVLQVLPPGDEGAGDEVHVVLDAEEDVLLVLLAEIGLAEDLVGEAHALVVGGLAPHQHPAHRVGGGELLHLKGEKTVVEENPVSHRQVLHHAGIAYRHTLLIAYDLLRGEGEPVPLPEGDLSLFKGADAVLGALGVQHDGDGKLQLLPHGLDEVNLLLVLGVGAVGKIQPGHIHARQAHGGEGLLVLTGGADGADDFCLAHNVLLFTKVMPCGN